jgi:biopolymer transport protein TolR
VTIQTDSKKVAAVINVTPLIDVLLVLLIVFMLLPSHTRGLQSDLPESGPAGAPAARNPQQVVLHILSDGSLQIDSQPVLKKELDARLRYLFAARPDGVLFVDGAGELAYSDVAAVIDTARGAGIARVGLLTQHDR